MIQSLDSRQMHLCRSWIVGIVVWQLLVFVFVPAFVPVFVPVCVPVFVPVFVFEFVQELDWYCGLVVCNYATGGNLPSGHMYQV